MTREYTLTSPSLEGILSHDSVFYEGLKRPALMGRIFDRCGKKMRLYSEDNRKIIEKYNQDLYGVLIKRLAEFAIDSDYPPDEPVKLTAMLQELINVKEMLSSHK